MYESRQILINAYSKPGYPKIDLAKYCARAIYNAYIKINLGEYNFKLFICIFSKKGYRLFLIVFVFFRTWISKRVFSRCCKSTKF